MNKRETKHFDNASEICMNLHFTFFIKSIKINYSQWRVVSFEWPHYSKGPQNLPKHQRSQKIVISIL